MNRFHNSEFEFQTALNQSIPMLRSNHLQPAINLNPISFPNTDLTLKVRESISLFKEEAKVSSNEG